MAQPERRLPENADGDFFVDDTCIDCDACRQIAPETFREHGAHSIVHRQPETEDDTRRALMALVACPTASIGTRSRRSAAPGVEAFPHPIADTVFFCGFTAESSFGAWSYLIVRPQGEGGNVLVDSPRFSAPLVRRIEAMGGVRLMFLTHRDDVADHARFAEKFGCERIMHAADGARRLGVERVLEGTAESRIDDDLVAIPTPGHTRGHAVLLSRNSFLFTGDHLAWDSEIGSLTAWPDVCWYSWPEQVRSLARLQSYRFEWVLPGHGRIHHDTAEAMQTHLGDLLRLVESKKNA
jgi:glyoxylase-like metal-dependent hydrolase (beta-lactamase superfamily II)/ferredoxin